MGQLKIVDGPTKQELKDALFEGDYLHRQPVQFTVYDSPQGSRRKCFIDSVERQIGGNEEWQFAGEVEISKHGGSLCKVKGVFSTATRQGLLIFDLE
ncbi:TPA: hypothetical protein DIV45_00460 [Patescibacteria group bacterium]|uniref:Uncharacterized protein n=1 Tax=candidate division Kazan bacterium GW2011_GWB1_45_10 TaxID=1620411 RepID=A0A0G1KTF0_UNCK3|nr:MAG: hypothetical protein VE97_C0017G0004 [candidate division Kazan bacterium GW2011_GWB1_45_10]HCR41837.1 hypothetical protein [Patescibacteria group bacterium]